MEPRSPLSAESLQPQEPNAPPTPQKSRKKLYIILATTLTAIALVVAIVLFYKPSESNRSSATVQPQTSNKTSSEAVVNTTGLQLDANKNYGNKYANGMLPVGDGKYVTDAPKNGYVYVCNRYAQNLKNDRGGAGVRGPWFSSNNTEYDINKKAHVSGSVPWTPQFSNNLNGNNRIIATNDLPNHTTGTFPIGQSDAAFKYDRNPNRIQTQDLHYTLTANPTYGTPQCMGGEAGVMLTGVAIFNGFDAGGRDAGAWEVQDSCSGHPQNKGEYHYHTLSSCIKDVSVTNVIGFALDGFPITGPKVGADNILTTSDLDECHGIISQVMLDGKMTTTYHYVMTQDFPYSISCFRAAPSQPPR